MQIKKILDCDEYGEADIIVTDGEFDLLCYANSYKNNDMQFTLDAFLTSNIMKANTKECLIKKTNESYYSYWLQGKIIDLEKRLIAIGNLIIKIEGCIPKDIKEDEYIEFDVIRIDFSQSQ